MRTDRADWVVIADSFAGAKAARAAGMPVLGFIGASHWLADHADSLLAKGAFAIIRHMSELPATIDKLLG